MLIEFTRTNFFFATYLAFSVSLNQCLSRRYTAVSTLRRLFAPYIGTTLWMAFTLSENPFLKNNEGEIHFTQVKRIRNLLCP